jgi:hypothetical protein
LISLTNFTEFLMGNGFSAGASLTFSIKSIATAYKEAEAFLGDRPLLKIGHNTLLSKRDGEYFVVFHGTEIVTITNKNIRLNSGGFRTATTKDRINTILPAGYHLTTKDGIWYLSVPQVGKVHFKDLMTIDRKGRVHGAGDEKKELALHKQIHKFAKGFADAFTKGEVPAPGPRDCWHCGLQTEKGDSNEHLLSHMKEPYYVPSLLVDAAKARGSGWLMNVVFPVIWDKSVTTEERKAFLKNNARSLKQYVARVLRQYLGSRLGLALR